MARPKGSVSLSSRLMGGSAGDAKLYEEASGGAQVYVHALWKRQSDGGRLRVAYVGQGKIGRSSDVTVRSKMHRAFLETHWVGRTLLFAKPRRLENIDWLVQQFAEFSIPDGLVIIETPFLVNALRVESRLIELYKDKQHQLFNEKIGKITLARLKSVPNYGCLRDHVSEIRSRKAEGEGTNALAREFGVDPASIRCVVRRSTYKDIP